jgi:hypothetical protein
MHNSAFRRVADEAVWKKQPARLLFCIQPGGFVRQARVFYGRSGAFTYCSIARAAAAW